MIKTTKIIKQNINQNQTTLKIMNRVAYKCVPKDIRNVIMKWNMFIYAVVCNYTKYL